MKFLATMFLALSLPNFPVAPPLGQPVDHVKKAAHKGGQWYFAENGHAVYCYGPVMMVKEPQGGLQRVATFCKGEKTMVPLKD